MSNQDDIRRVIEQEKALVFDAFDEAAAFKIGAALRERGVAEKLGIAAEVRTWGRPLFYMALSGTNGDNANWIRRKANTVNRLMKASYRVVLEKNWDSDVFPPRRGLDNMEFVLAGGAFPITVKGAGIIGAITVSGLHERDDHRLVVDAIADHLGQERAALALPPL